MPRNRACPLCHQVGCDCDAEGGGGLRIAESLYGLQPFSVSIAASELNVRSSVSAGIGGFDRPPEVVQTVDEVKVRFTEVSEPVLVCAYCSERHRTLSRNEGVRWFLDHACEGEGVDIEKWLQEVA